MSSSSSSGAVMNPLVGIVITEKLSKNNHVMWKAQVLPTVRGARLVGHLTGATAPPAVEIDEKIGYKVSNPAFERCYATDQQVFGFVLASLTREVLPQVSAKETATQLWGAIEVMFASRTRTRAINTRLALATASKGNQSVTSSSSTSSPASTPISLRSSLPSPFAPIQCR